MGVAKTCISEICEKEHELKAFGMLNGMWGLGKSLQIDRKITTEESCESTSRCLDREIVLQKSQIDIYKYAL